mmetsp:Transcript_19856/g.45095  ORF Transcript_19856/g.45095 Transcript_19856/m.45095 type:complete len:225 (+) Transcript_19856:1350-2024(+)
MREMPIRASDTPLFSPGMFTKQVFSISCSSKIESLIFISSLTETDSSAKLNSRLEFESKLIKSVSGIMSLRSDPKSIEPDLIFFSFGISLAKLKTLLAEVDRFLSFSGTPWEFDSSTELESRLESESKLIKSVSEVMSQRSNPKSIELDLVFITFGIPLAKLEALLAEVDKFLSFPGTPWELDFFLLREIYKPALTVVTIRLPTITVVREPEFEGILEIGSKGI